MGRDHISKGVSQLLKESPGGGSSKCKGNSRHYVLQGDQEVVCMVNQGQLGRRPSQKASRGQDDAGPSRPKGLGLNSGGAVGVGGLKDMI